MDEKAIAFHEAGHAVIARVLGITVTKVAMFATDGNGGAAGAQAGSASWLANEASRSAQIRAAEMDAKVCLAGLYAQQKYRPSKVKHRVPLEWRNDFELAKQFVVKAILLETDPTFNLPTEKRDVILSPDKSAQVATRFDQIGTDVKGLVEDNWTAIEQTAGELLRHRVISGDDVDAIISQHKEKNL